MNLDVLRAELRRASNARDDAMAAAIAAQIAQLEAEPDDSDVVPDVLFVEGDR